jgi:hypothetical protein
MDSTLGYRKKTLAAAAVLGLAAALTAACAEETGPGNGTVGLGNGEPAEQPGAGADEVMLELMGPLDGDVVTVPFDVVVGTDVELGPIADEVHHLHIWFGDDPTDQTGFDLYEADQVLVENAPNGEQTMWVQIHTFDHQPASEPVSVSLTIQGGTDGGGGGEESGGGPYDY